MVKRPFILKQWHFKIKNRVGGKAKCGLAASFICNLVKNYLDFKIYPTHKLPPKLTVYREHQERRWSRHRHWLSFPPKASGKQLWVWDQGGWVSEWIPEENQSLSLTWPLTSPKLEVEDDSETSYQAALRCHSIYMSGSKRKAPYVQKSRLETPSEQQLQH